MEQVLSFVTATVVASVIGIVLIVGVERLALTIRRWAGKQRAFEAPCPAQGRLLDARTTRRWMRFSSEDQ